MLEYRRVFIYFYLPLFYSILSHIADKMQTSENTLKHSLSSVFTYLLEAVICAMLAILFLTFLR